MDESIPSMDQLEKLGDNIRLQFEKLELEFTKLESVTRGIKELRDVVKSIDFSMTSTLEIYFDETDLEDFELLFPPPQKQVQMSSLPTSSMEKSEESACQYLDGPQPSTSSGPETMSLRAFRRKKGTFQHQKEQQPPTLSGLDTRSLRAFRWTKSKFQHQKEPQPSTSTSEPKPVQMTSISTFNMEKIEESEYQYRKGPQPSTSGLKKESLSAFFPEKREKCTHQYLKESQPSTSTSEPKPVLTLVERINRANFNYSIFLMFNLIAQLEYVGKKVKLLVDPLKVIDTNFREFNRMCTVITNLDDETKSRYEREIYRFKYATRRNSQQLADNRMDDFVEKIMGILSVLKTDTIQIPFKNYFFKLLLKLGMHLGKLCDNKRSLRENCELLILIVDHTYEQLPQQQNQ